MNAVSDKFILTSKLMVAFFADLAGLEGACEKISPSVGRGLDFDLGWAAENISSSKTAGFEASDKKLHK